MSDKKLIQLRKLKKYFPVNSKGALKAVEDVSFTIYEGEKFGVVGESGCGKSTLGRTILQLYKQTSGSCVYYGKSIQEIDPEYIKKEIEKLPSYQNKAKEFYDKSIALDNKVQSLEASKVQYDVNGNSKDAKEYDKLSKQIAKLQFESKELKKDASRQLREGSRTVGSLILCKDLDKVQDLFNKAHKELHECHNAVTKLWKLKDIYENNKVVINQIEHIDEWIKEETDKSELNPQEKTHLEDLYYIKKKNYKYTVSELEAANEKLEPQIDELEKEVEEHKNKEEAYRKEAFDKYRGKDILAITELTMDKEYQDKLDSNYETGVNLSKLTNEELRAIRPDLQMVFQDPAASLDPRQTIGKAIEEVFAIHTDMPAALRREKTLELLTKVNLKQEHYYAYPHSLSGGMKQRAGIARAIALDPSFIVLDEAVSALDVSVQAQILQLLNQLREERDLTYLFITHDLGVVKHFCDRVLVMYLGNVCELASAKELFKESLHPYTKSLLDAVPRLKVDKNHSEENILQGEVPSPINPPKGCPFHTRCKNCMEICKKEKPKYTEVKENHFVACHLFDERGNN